MKLVCLFLTVLLVIFINDLYKTINNNGNPFIPILICISIIFIGVSGFIFERKYQKVSEIIKK